MLLSTMSYEEIYREILKDFRDVKVYYDIAIKVWTKSDVEKRNIAKLNKINFIEIFSIDFNHIISELIDNNIITNLI